VTTQNDIPEVVMLMSNYFEQRLDEHTSKEGGWIHTQSLDFSFITIRCKPLIGGVSDMQWKAKIFLP